MCVSVLKCCVDKSIFFYFFYLIASQLYESVDFSSDEDFRGFTALSGISLLTEKSAERKTLKSSTFSFVYMYMFNKRE